MVATEIKTLIYWLNTLDLPSALLVDSLDDLRDGKVLHQLVSIGATKQTSQQHFDNILLQRFGSIITHTKALDSKFGHFIDKFTLEAVVSSISQGQQTGDQILLEILRALHRISTSGRRRGLHQPPKDNYKKVVTRSKHSSNTGIPTMSRDASKGTFPMKRRLRKDSNLERSGQTAQAKQKLPESIHGTRLQGASSVLQALHNEFQQEAICCDLRTTVRWLLLPPLLPSILRKLEDAGGQVGPFEYVKKSESGLPILLAKLFADGVLLCMVVSELERLAGSKVPFVEKHLRRGKLVVLSGLELEPKTHGSKLRNVNISLNLLKKNSKVAPRHLFSAEKLVEITEPAIAYELLDDIRRGYKTPQSWRKRESLSFAPRKLSLVEKDQSGSRAQIETDGILNGHKRRVKGKRSKQQSVDEVVESLLCELKSEEILQWAIRKGLVEKGTEYDNCLHDPLCNGAAIKRFLGNPPKSERVPASKEEAEEVLANLLGKVAIKVPGVDLSSEAIRLSFARSIFSRGRPACLLLVRALQEADKSSSKAPYRKQVSKRSKEDLLLLEESINAWLVALGLKPRNAASFLTSKESANGVLLAKVSEIILNKKIVGIFARPKTPTLIAKNFEKSLLALRKESKLSRRYLFNPEALLGRDCEVVLGLYEDLHRFHSGLPPRKEVSGHPEPVFLGQQSNQVATRVSSPVSPPHVLPESNIANAELVWVPHDQDYTKSVEHGWLFEEYADIYPDTKGCDVDSISCRPSRDEFRWSALHRSETDILPSSSGWGQREEKENCFVDDSALADSEEVNPDVDLLELCEQLHIKAQVRNIDEFSHLFVNGVRLCKLVEQVTNAPIAGVQLQPKTKAARIHNIRAALATLQHHRQMPNEHLWDEYEIERGNSAVLVALLDQIRTAFPHHP